MAEIWEYIANYNPQGFYEDNRSKMLSNDINTARLKAVNRENQMQDLILKLKQRVANGDNTALKELGIYSPETNKQYIENEDEMLKMARPYAQAILKMSPENREKGYQQMYKAISGSIDMSDAPAHYDEEFVTLIANSDPQKIHDDRLNEQAIERMNIQHTLNEDANENQLGRDLRKLQYAYDRADQKTKEGIDFITSQVREGNIDRNAAITAAGKLLGVDLAIKSDAEKLAEDYVTGRMTPEEEQAFLSRRKALTQATSTKATGRTPAQELKDLYGAGYSPESILKFSQTGDVNDLEARPVQGGSIAADVQKYNVYNQEKSRLETQLGRPLDEKEDLSLQSKLGITSQELQNGKLAVQHGFKMDEINAQGQNALKTTDLRNQGLVNVANINANSRRETAEIGAGARMYAADKAYQTKMDYAKFMQDADWNEAVMMADAINKANPDNPPLSPVDIVNTRWTLENAKKQAEINAENAKVEQAKAQINKLMNDIENTSKTNPIKEAERLMQENPELSFQDAYAMTQKGRGTNVTVNNTEQDAFAKQLGKNSAEQVKKNEEAIESSRNQLFMLNNMADSLERANDVNVYFGPGGEFVYQMKSLAQALGKDTKGLSDTAIIQTGKSMLMASLRKDLMPGQLSDRDLRFLVNMMPGVEKTVEQNRAILNMYKKMHEQKIRYATAYNDYMFKNNGDARGWNNYAQEMDIFKSPNETIFTKEDFDAVRGNSKNSGKIMSGKISWSIDE